MTFIKQRKKTMKYCIFQIILKNYKLYTSGYREEILASKNVLILYPVKPLIVNRLNDAIFAQFMILYFKSKISVLMKGLVPHLQPDGNGYFCV